MMKNKNLLLLAIFAFGICNAHNEFSPQQRDLIAEIIRQELRHQQPKGTLEEIKSYLTKGAGYTACTLGLGFGLYEFKNACASMVKYFTPTTTNTRNEKRRHGIFAASHFSVGLLCCTVSGYGLYHLLNQNNTH